MHEIMSKVLTNNLKPILSSIILDSQCTFVPDRLGTYNNVVAHEKIHYLRHKRNRKQGFMSIKLDMSKAYHKVDWNFFE